MISSNLAKIRERIASVSGRIGKNPQEITVVAVSKGVSAELIRQAQDAAITDIGENKIQEALIKYNEFKIEGQKSPIKWHMVGHLQTNKAKDAVKIFDLIQSLDSLRLALEIDKQAARINKVQDVLIQVNTSEEDSKFGLAPEGAIEVIKEINRFANLNIKGLMAIGPFTDDQQRIRACFKRLRDLQENINNLQLTAYSLQLLSMGMSDDYEIAIEEGANMIRLGRAIYKS